MTKAAIASLTQCMGMDHAHQNIRINAVYPNEVNKPMLRTGFAKRGFDPDNAVAQLNKTVPLVRISEPEDNADVVLFLASDAARYMCGSLVEINGGKGRRVSRFTGEVALVTGGRNGIGQAMARQLAKEGARILMAQRGANDEFEGSESDLSDTAACAQAIDEVVKRSGRLDVLVNNAAAMQEARVEDMSLAD